MKKRGGEREGERSTRGYAHEDGFRSSFSRLNDLRLVENREFQFCMIVDLRGIPPKHCVKSMKLLHSLSDVLRKLKAGFLLYDKSFYSSSVEKESLLTSRYLSLE